MSLQENSAGSPRDFSVAQLKLIRRTVARECSDAEFDEFIAVAQHCGLDPLRRQITPLILGGARDAGRRLVCWATIDGLRVIAARQGDYRPMETAPLIECDPVRIDPDTNPLGLIRAEVRVWKRSGDVWHAVAGEAWWDEVAPLNEEWGANATGVREPTGRRILDPSWRRMSRIMIAKCAEAQALRRGWPDLMSGLYSQEELHAARLAEKTASEKILGLRSAPKIRGTRTLWFVFEPGGALVPVKLNEVFARLSEIGEGAPALDRIAWFAGANRSSLATFWDWAPDEALELKKRWEAVAAVAGNVHQKAGRVHGCAPHENAADEP